MRGPHDPGSAVPPSRLARQLPQHVQAKLDERIDAAEQLRREQFRHHAAEPPAVLQRVGEAIGEAGAIRQHLHDPSGARMRSAA